MYDLLERILDPDLQLQIEQQYLDLYNELPVGSLLDRLERLQRAVPPDDLPEDFASATVPDVQPDSRQAAALEPFLDGRVCL